MLHPAITRTPLPELHAPRYTEEGSLDQAAATLSVTDTDMHGQVAHCVCIPLRRLLFWARWHERGVHRAHVTERVRP